MLWAPACVFISCGFGAGDSYKDTNQGMRNEDTGRRKFLYLLTCEQKQRNREPVHRLVPESKQSSRGGGGGRGGEGRETNFYLESFSETFAVTKIIIILKFIES